MMRFIKLVSKCSVGFFVIMSLLLIAFFGYETHHDYTYHSPNEFLNSKSSSWYIHVFPASSHNIFVRTFVETSEMIMIFEANKKDEIPVSQLYAIISSDKGRAILKNLNISTFKKQSFLNRGELYCYFYQNKSPYLVSKYYSNHNDIAHYLFASLGSQEALEVCR